MKTVNIFLMLLVLVCGCGDGGDEAVSGLDRSRQVSTLDETEQSTLCEATTAARGGPGKTVDCGDGVTVTSQTISECQQDFSRFENCDLTVGDLEDCANAGSGPCDVGAVFNSPACQKMFACGE